MARESIKKMLNHKTGDITSRYVHANVNSLRPMFDEIAQGLMLNYDGSYLGDAGLAEVTVSKSLFQKILALIDDLRRSPVPA